MDTFYCDDIEHLAQDWDLPKKSPFPDYKQSKLPLRNVIGEPHGLFLFHEVQSGGYTVQYNLFDISKDIKLTIIGTEPLPNLFFNLWTPLPFAMDGGPVRFADPYDYCMENKPTFKWEAHLKKGKQYGYMYVYLPAQKFLDIAEGQVLLAPFLACFSNFESSIFPAEFAHPTSDILKDITKIIQCLSPIPDPELFLGVIAKVLTVEGVDNLLRDDTPFKGRRGPML